MSKTGELYIYKIDGSYYDLTKFIKLHPGGDDICFFAGLDVSIHYKMVHNRSFDH
jgi:cytochrome b involved in lipid metabolism